MRSSRAAELDGVDGLDDVEELDRPAGLVRLERPDEVPASRPARSATLSARLLDAVLAELVSPAATAARSRSAGTVLETATRVTSAGSRPASRHASAIRSSTAWRARAKAATSRGSTSASSVGMSGGLATGRLLAAKEARDLQVVRVVGRGRLLGRPPARRPIARRAGR